MRTHARHGIAATLVALSTAALTLFGPTPAQAAPPTPVSAATARSYLASLTVTTEHSRTGYSRDLFPHWITISGTCNTRETVLKRDGSNVVTDSSCAATSGSWYSPYDGATWYAAGPEHRRVPDGPPHRRSPGAAQPDRSEAVSSIAER